MATLYEIRNWNELYENAGSRKVKGALDWFQMPTKHDGLSFRRLMKRKDRMELYAAWTLILAVAAKCKTRGVLANDDGPLTAEDIALKTGGDEAVIERALQVFSGKDINWLSGSTLPGYPDDLALQEMTGQDIRGEDKTEQSLSGSQANADRADVSEQVCKVFDHYRTHHPKAHKSPQRASKEWKAIAARLSEGSSVDELCEAIDGCHKTPHNLGQNDRQQAYLGLELIMRNGDQVARFMEANARAGPVLSRGSQQASAAIESLMAKEFGSKSKPLFENEHVQH